jgi:hypothetical protein
VGDAKRLATGRTGRVDIRCIGCGYGGVVARLPDRCPMCGTRRWRRMTSSVRRSDEPADAGSAQFVAEQFGYP